ncbi:MAG: aminotransferase class I/II-fold pyridoxal phosphate-dependent enzyme [Planctomycetes bacterium]|nr:aminotransferase class I/II-fold pyridoxal phosphate-dependent enzyme [Planctomycetota bacterium]
MPRRSDDVCPSPAETRLPDNSLAPPLFLGSVYRCESPEDADRILGGEAAGYVYQRDGHPNAAMLAEKCRLLHGAERAAVASSGMAALALAVLSLLRPGDHVVVSRLLYGKSRFLLTDEAARWGLTSTLIDPCDLEQLAAAMTPATRLVVVETIANPLLQVADVAALAEIVHRNKAKLLVDNTFATPVMLRPLEHGADLVLESVTKMINGHSDVVLGLLCGGDETWDRVPGVLSAWGLTAAPFDCWLAYRGLTTLHLRMERACANAMRVARFLAARPEVEKVFYPGLAAHPQHALAKRQFGDRFGWVVSLRLRGGRAAADAFIAAVQGAIPFCPSLGEASTTLSHPETTSHRGLSPEERQRLGIDGGVIRLSLGIESPEFVCEALHAGLEKLGYGE